MKSNQSISWSNVFGHFVLPAVTLLLVPWCVLSQGVVWQKIVALIIFWCLIGAAITAGYHRLHSHRSWRAPFPIRLMLAILGAAAWQNRIKKWAADHREQKTNSEEVHQ
jgi:stearoyl-CoA desaturase (delta-9 desaturase)